MYCIEGNIGAGKSTLVKCLAQKYTCFEEPVKEWHLLENFYKDMDIFALPFQYQVLLTQFKQLKEINKFNDSQVCFMERCPWTSRNVFFKMLLDQNILTYDDLKFYDKLYNNTPQNIKKMFFLMIDPKKCKERILKRNRFEERNIELSYLESLEKQYINSLIHADFEVEYIFVNDKTPEELAEEIIKKLT